MSTKRETYYIYRNLVRRKVNPLSTAIYNIFLKNYRFDHESLEYLKETEKGHVVYVSFQSSCTALKILLRVLRINNFALPEVALDYMQTPLLKIMNFFHKYYSYIRNLIEGNDNEHDETYSYLKGCFQEKKPVAISLLSGTLFQKRYIDIKIDSLQYLIEIQQTMDEPILVFPHTMFWNRAQEKAKGLRPSRATDNRGFFMALMSSLQRFFPGLVRISKPINLQEVIEKSKSKEPEIIARQLRNDLLDVYNSEKRTIIGPVAKDYNEMMEKVLFHNNVLEVIEQEMAASHSSLHSTRKKAYKYYKEIAADLSFYYIYFLKSILDRIFSKIFHGIHFNKSVLSRLREAMRQGPIILMPNHKSHMDYLILSYLLYKNNIMVPHIVAGVNLAFFPMGHIFRRSGAFFMRRTFKGNNLYTVIFKQYIKTIVNEGYPIEFFPEGTRTRTGKLGFPKMGITKYLVDAMEEGYNTDMIFIPIAINYDRILEENSYHNELKGQSKQTESTSSFFKSRKLLKRNYGAVYLDIGEPISFQEVRKKTKDVIETTQLIGDMTVKSINNVMVVTPFSLVTTAMLLQPSTGFTLEKLQENTLKLYHYLKFAGASMADTIDNDEDIENIIPGIVDSYMNDGILRIEDISEQDLLEETATYTIDIEQRGRINFSKNTVIHLLLPLSFLSLALLRGEKEKKLSLADITKWFNKLKTLFSSEFVYTDFMLDDEKPVTTTLKFLTDQGLVTQQGGEVKLKQKNIPELTSYASIITDYLESYLTAAKTLDEMPEKKKIYKKDLLDSMRKRAVELYTDETITKSESIAVPNFTNALSCCVKAGICTQEVLDKKKTKIDIINRKKLQNHKASLEKWLKLVE